VKATGSLLVKAQRVAIASVSEKGLKPRDLLGATLALKVLVLKVLVLKVDDA
jgi:hypothetical protein